ncbi:NRDE family protein [Pontixanthobacter aquaemixtae]|uniref:Transport and Golgi organisation 2 n=1 Tax=Pontixanthobacter aquaemixtae TaxID=1958940 RepID=A0A844ZRJ9_9SPHN|nr:NRDE family protein [Pontixanthobacter aquaemixtae]MXO89942.1 hypothetical protein [Pontixanthobacter aquaemixtae]
MCVAALAWQVSEKFPLVAIGNRDEFHDRPTTALSRWEDDAGIIAGRDEGAGGTWLGVSKLGQFVLLTNFRDPENVTIGPVSRGKLVEQILRGEEPKQIEDMNAFNVVQANLSRARFLSNRGKAQWQELSSGIHGVSNGPLDRPWPKTLQLGGVLERWIEEGTGEIEPLFTALRAETPEPSAEQPIDAPQPEYAPVFIRNPVYGTRSSSVVIVNNDGRGLIAERSFDASAAVTGEKKVEFTWPQV